MDEKQLLWVLLAVPILIVFFRNTDNESVPLWRYGPDAIEIHYRADPGLNLFNGRPHTLVLVIYQLSDSAQFQEKTMSADGLRDLLTSKRFDQSVVGIHNMIVQPGGEQNVSLDRAEHAQWIGIVAGYQTIRTGAINYLGRIPVTTEVSGWLRKKKQERVDDLILHLDLGTESISKVDISHGK